MQHLSPGAAGVPVHPLFADKEDVQQDRGGRVLERPPTGVLTVGQRCRQARFAGDVEQVPVHPPGFLGQVRRDQQIGDAEPFLGPVTPQPHCLFGVLGKHRRRLQGRIGIPIPQLPQYHLVRVVLGDRLRGVRCRGQEPRPVASGMSLRRNRVPDRAPCSTAVVPTRTANASAAR